MDIQISDIDKFKNLVFLIFILLTIIGDRSPKLVAIVVGSFVILALGIGLCSFAKSCGKKNDGKSTLHLFKFYVLI